MEWNENFTETRYINNDKIIIGHQDFEKGKVLIKEMKTGEIIECQMCSDANNDIYFIYYNHGVYISPHLGSFIIGDIHFEWNPDKEDDDLYHNGKTFMWINGRSAAVQKFVEALSYKIKFKCDFSRLAGRCHVEVSHEGYNAAIAAVTDNEFMKQFIVPYSQETYMNGTYFEVASII